MGTLKSTNGPAGLLFFLVASCPSTDRGDRSAPAAAPGKDDAHGFIPKDYPEPFGADLTRSWLDPWSHSHFSRRGTPFVHLLNLEPAFMDRDLFLDYRRAQGFDGDETEMAAELELALTRRIGLVIELPFVQLDPVGGNSQAGVGDFAIAPRALLVDTEAFLLSGNLEFAFPSGDKGKGLGNGEVSIAPSLSAWFDLGHWFQASIQTGTEQGLDSGNMQAFFNAALAYSFLTPGLVGVAWHDHDHPGAHFPSGLTNLIVELTRRTVLRGPDEGRDTGEILFGLGYNLTGDWEARCGYQVPVGGATDMNRAFVLSLIRHF